MDAEEQIRFIQEQLDAGFISTLYNIASIDKSDFFLELKNYDMKINSQSDMYYIPVENIDKVAHNIVKKTSMKNAISGAMFGFGGISSLAPECMALMVNILRLAQRLSLLYGFDFQSSEDNLEFWLSIGRGMNISLILDGSEQDLYKNISKQANKPNLRDPLLVKIAQKILLSIAMQSLKKVTRMVPLIGASTGSIANYVYIKHIGNAFIKEFRARHDIARLVNNKDLLQDVQFLRV